MALFEANCLAQSGHCFLERVVLESARGHQRGERLGDDIERLLRGLSAVGSWSRRSSVTELAIFGGISMVGEQVLGSSRPTASASCSAPLTGSGRRSDGLRRRELYAGARQAEFAAWAGRSVGGLTEWGRG